MRSTAREPRAYTVALTDPSVPIAAAAPATGELAVGASEFFRYEASPGELLRVDLRSAAFDPFLRLYDAEGRELASNDDAGDDLDSRIGLLVHEGGSFLLQVSARGDGGGGAYTLAVEEREISHIAPGEVQTALLGQDGTRYWHFDGRAGQTVLVSVRSATCDPSVEVLGPDGVILGRDQDGGVEQDCLLPLKLSRAGRHTFWVSARGGGECEVRLIALD